MTSLRLIAVLLAMVCVNVAFKCYSGKYQKDQKPAETTDCPQNRCMKIQLKSDSGAYYQCDMTNACVKDGCETDKNGDMMCCCSKDLCNSSQKITALFTIVPIALMKLFA